jgi:hypothetical protein
MEFLVLIHACYQEGHFWLRVNGESTLESFNCLVDLLLLSVNISELLGSKSLILIVELALQVHLLSNYLIA